MNKRLGALIVFFCLSVVLCPTHGQTEEPREYLIKAAFIYNFAKFVDWPVESFKNDVSPINLCILGSDPFGSTIDTIKDKQVRGRKLVIKRIRQIEHLEDCHILFICNSEKNNLHTTLNALKNKNILTISDLEKFASSGGMIGLVAAEDKIQFEINQNVVNRSKIKISSQLLKLAKIVQTGTGGIRE